MSCRLAHAEYPFFPIVSSAYLPGEPAIAAQAGAAMMRWMPQWCQRGLVGLSRPKQVVPPEVCRARDLIAAIDKGGVPLNPAVVNQIGRSLGLEVSSKARIEETVERIRQALTRL